MPTSTPNRHAFADALKRGLYETIFRRRDIREFISDPIPDEVLARVLVAAHHAASVGFTQPWDFIIVRDVEQRRRVRQVFEDERQRTRNSSPASAAKSICRSSSKASSKRPLNLIVTCKPDRFGPAVLGKTSIHEVEIYSTCLAVENLWLAARAEGLGVGWVSILRNDALAEIFGIPADVIPIAYLCVGYVREFPDRPILASKDWAQRLPPRSLIHFDTWNDAEDRTKPAAESLLKKIDNHSIWLSIFPEDSPDKPPSRE